MLTSRLIRSTLTSFTISPSPFIGLPVASSVMADIRSSMTSSKTEEISGASCNISNGFSSSRNPSGLVCIAHTACIAADSLVHHNTIRRKQMHGRGSLDVLFAHGMGTLYLSNTVQRCRAGHGVVSTLYLSNTVPKVSCRILSTPGMSTGEPPEGNSRIILSSSHVRAEEAKLKASMRRLSELGFFWPSCSMQQNVTTLTRPLVLSSLNKSLSYMMPSHLQSPEDSCKIANDKMRRPVQGDGVKA